MSVESVTSNMNALFCDENSHGALASNLPGHRDEVFYITTGKNPTDLHCIIC